MNDRESQVLEQLKWSVQALAQPAEVQVTLFPVFVCVADELALDLQNWLLAAKGQNIPLGPAAISRITDIDQELSALSGKAHEEFWNVHALKNDMRWENIRERARAALAAAGWENAAPPFGRSTYAAVHKT